jgi:hypothetical protein
MEPISYLMLLGNFTFSFGWYVSFLEKPELQNPISWYKERVINKLKAKNGITDEEINELTTQIMEVR